MTNRKLIPAEQVMEILNRCAGSSLVVTISCIKGPLSVDMVRQALSLAQHRHPQLQLQIVGSLNNLRFAAKLLPIPLRVVAIAEEQWQAIVWAELNQRIESHDRSAASCTCVS